MIRVASAQWYSDRGVIVEEGMQYSGRSNSNCEETEAEEEVNLGNNKKSQRIVRRRTRRRRRK